MSLHAIVIGVKWLLCVLVQATAACSSEPLVTPGVAQDSSVEDTTAVVEVGPDGAPFPVRRSACVTRAELAKDLPVTQMGALEGELLSIVPPGHKTCPSGPNHLHLQVAVGSKRYDVAVRVDSEVGAPLAIFVQNKPLSPIPADGWSGALFDYTKDIGKPSADYQALTRDALLARLQTELANASRVRIFGSSYTDGTGVDKVHRNGREGDGAIYIHHYPSESGGDRVIALRFSNDVF